MKLQRREKLLIWAGSIILLVVGIYLLILEPMADRRKYMIRETAELRLQVQEMRNLAEQYKTLARRREQIQQQVSEREQGFAPFSYLENMARQAGLTGQIESMSPVASAPGDDQINLAQFDLRLGGIGLPQLVRFLYSIESSDKVFFVVNLNIRPRYLSPELLDVSLRLATPSAQ
jgi:hypothetical protein